MTSRKDFLFEDDDNLSEDMAPPDTDCALKTSYFGFVVGSPLQAAVESRL